MKSIEVTLIDEVTGENLKELTIEGAEIALDTFLDEGVLQQIPFFGTLYKGSKAILGIREWIFAKKVYKFLTQLQNIPQEKRRRFIEKLESNKDYRQSVGEKLIVILDQLDDLDKPQIIGRLLAAAIEEQISYQDFLRLSAIVQKAFVPDLIKLKTGFVSQYIEEQFVTIGIYSIKLGDDGIIRRYSTFGGSDDRKILPIVKYEINDLGDKLCKYGLGSS